MAAPPILSGELGLLSLFDLGQLLMLNGASGALVVHHEGRRSFLYFERGQIVDALDDTHRGGELAAYKIFTIATGRFEFRVDTLANSTPITEGTEGLMMEAARRMDEAGEAAGESGDRAVEKLARRSNALDALREAFQLVLQQPGAMPDAEDSPFALLSDASDALLFRPGQAPRALKDGRWRTVARQVLDKSAFEQLRARLFDGVWNAALSGTENVASCVITYTDQRRYAITRVSGAHEALWVRAAEQAPPEAGLLEGELGHLRALLHAPAGLVLVGGPDAESADRMLHACVALTARERGGTVVLCADHGRWRHRDEAGAVLRAGAADTPELLRALAPDVVAYDTSSAPGSLTAMHAAPLVLAAIVAPDAGSLLPRWVERVGRRWGDGIEALCGTTLVGLVQAGRPAANGRQAFRANRCARDGEVTAAPAEHPHAAAPADAVATPAEAAASIAEALAQATADAPPPAVVAEPAAPAPEAPAPTPVNPDDPFAELAAELGRTLRKAA
ncbi:MAG: DUF4388 domain-containing protein [Candidatus Eisenbacteria bacterium]